ncbi:SAM-dependent methyltransferase [Sulfuricella sp. T08]|uniref:class I SAM-dependent methyltransferase n=1 Tax=Sulfuricella sp. T08 TaxID=1632857 RepID=UPI00061797C2|nr:methyltransferase domain-containing protein [Sulfuricella sp. T08]GAO37490.1 SAM-dependent methyltransferase [Sulfuricella sp. T08]
MNPDQLFVSAPSEWVVRCAPLIRSGGRVLDVACGTGRHTRFLIQAGFKVEAVDRDVSALAFLPGVVARQADLEGEPWPYSAGELDGIVVTNYLYRPLFLHLFEALAVGGVLIYETFSEGNQRLGRPRNTDYLLKSGELLEQVKARLEVNDYEELCVLGNNRAVVQRICAVKAAR